MQRLVVFGESIVTMSVRDSHYSPEDIISSDYGLQFAFAITAYDGNRESIEDPRYGTVNAKYVTWGMSESVQAADNSQDYLSYHICTREDLGLVEG